MTTPLDDQAKQLQEAIDFFKLPLSEAAAEYYDNGALPEHDLECAEVLINHISTLTAANEALTKQVKELEKVSSELAGALQSFLGDEDIENEIKLARLTLEKWEAIDAAMKPVEKV